MWQDARSNRIAAYGALQLSRFSGYFPHIHHGKSYFFARLSPQERIKLIHTIFRSVLATKPDTDTSLKITHHNTVRMPLAYLNFLNPYDFWSRSAGAFDLLSRVLLLKLLNRFPEKMMFLCNVQDSFLAALTTDVTHESLCKVIVICKGLDTLLLYHAISFILRSTNLELKKDPNRCIRQIPSSISLSIIPAKMNSP
jgi:hypothetical protein